MAKFGYHNIEIPKGKLGEFSKIEEEFLELTDAVNQENKLLIFGELADMIGAIKLYAKSFNLELVDLIKMKDATAEAFKQGHR